MAIYSTFLQRAYDQIYHDVCLMDLPVVFVLDRAGIVPDDGPTHQGVNDIAYLRHMPHMIVMAPKDENELQHMLWSASPTATRRRCASPRPRAWAFPWTRRSGSSRSGQSELVKDGRDLLFAFGNHGRRRRSKRPRSSRRTGSRSPSSTPASSSRSTEEMILRFAGPGRTVVTRRGGHRRRAAPGAPCASSSTGRAGSTSGSWRSACRSSVYPVGKADEIRAMVGLDVPGLVRQIKDLYQDAPLLRRR